MKIKFNQILNGVQAYNELQTLKFPPTLSLSIYKLGKELDRELQTYRDLSKQIYERYEVPQSPQGFDLQNVSSEDMEKLTSDLRELMENDVEISDIKVSFKDFERAGVDISPSLIGGLEWAFDFGETTPAAQTDTIESATVA